MSENTVRINCVRDDCGTFVMDRQLRDRYKRTGESFHCPAGHSMHFTETTEQKLRARIEELEDQLERTETRAERTRERQSELWQERNQLRGAVSDLLQFAAEDIVTERGSGVVKLAANAHTWVCECGGRGRSLKRHEGDAERLYEQHQEQSCGLAKQPAHA